jgi:hypothetical protein
MSELSEQEKKLASKIRERLQISPVIADDRALLLGTKGTFTRAAAELEMATEAINEAMPKMSDALEAFQKFSELMQEATKNIKP